MNEKFYVYVLFRPDGSPCYVGKGTRRRWMMHEWSVNSGRRHYNPHLEIIIRDARGTIPKIKLRENITEKDALDIERVMIAAIGREDNGGPLVNMTDGGEGVSGFKLPESAKDLIGKLHLGNTYRLGMKASDETKAKQRAAKLGRKLSAEHRAAIGVSNHGKIRSVETGRLISASKLGKKRSEETRAKLRGSNRSKEPAIRAKISLTLIQIATYRRQFMSMIA